MDFDYSVDTHKMREKLQEFPSQIMDAAHIAMRGLESLSPSFDKIVLLGMGASGVACSVIQDYLRASRIPIPVIVQKDYAHIEYENALVFVMSYSGNTEETIDAYRFLARRGRNTCVVVTSGGKLAQLAPMFQSTLLQVPSGLSPRLALGYMVIPAYITLLKTRVLPADPVALKQTESALSKDVYEGFAKDLVSKLENRIPVVYSSSLFSSTSYFWKTVLNETAKTIAFANVVPELCHNELEAYSDLSPIATDALYVLLLKDLQDEPRVKQKMDGVKLHLKEHKHHVAEVTMRGEHLLARMFSLQYLGLWVAYYLALAKKVDPTPISRIEAFKAKYK